jgi:hypothetical protein
MTISEAKKLHTSINTTAKESILKLLESKDFTKEPFGSDSRDTIYCLLKIIESVGAHYSE